MAYQRRSFGGFVDPPPIADPMQSLAAMMQMAGSLENFQEGQKQRRTQASVQKAINDAKGDYEGAAKILEDAGDFVTAKPLREQAKQQRAQALQETQQRLGLASTVFGKGAEILRQVEAKPELYPDLRPQIVDLASQLDPRLGAEIPEAYNPEQVRGMLDFSMRGAEVATTRARALQTLTATQAAQKDALERVQAHRKVVGDWFSVSTDQDDWDQSRALAASHGIDQDILDELGPTWSPEAQEKARKMMLTGEQREEAKPTTIVAAILRARDAGDKAAEQDLLKLQRTMAAADKGGGIDAGTIQAVMANPTIWGDVSPTLRAEMLPHLAKAGFDFEAAANTLTEGQKGQIERWYTDSISEIRKAVREGDLTDEQAVAEEARIKASYDVQMRGREKPVKAGTPEARAKASTEKQGVLPAEKRTPVPKVGDTVTLKDGRKVKVLSIGANGTLDVEAVQ